MQKIDEPINQPTNHLNQFEETIYLQHPRSVVVLLKFLFLFSVCSSIAQLLLPCFIFFIFPFFSSVYVSVLLHLVGTIMLWVTTMAGSPGGSVDVRQSTNDVNSSEHGLFIPDGPIQHIYPINMPTKNRHDSSRYPHQPINRPIDQSESTTSTT